VSGRGFGWLEDAPLEVTQQLTQNHVSKLIGDYRIPTQTKLDYTPFLGGYIPDQGSTSSCVGQAFRTSIWLTAVLARIPIPWPSAKAIYDFARAEDQPYVTLSDIGSRPLAAIRCLVEKGLVAEKEWPILTMTDTGVTNINKRPPMDVYQSALAAKVGAYYRIAPGPGAVTLIKTALAGGYFPVFAMPVDQQFQWWTSGIYPGRKGLALGGHMQAIAGWADGCLLVPGSWGRAFAENGIVRIANEYIESGECTDIIVCTAVPNALAA
jgi:hypothetical protein